MILPIRFLCFSFSQPRSMRQCHVKQGHDQWVLLEWFVIFIFDIFFHDWSQLVVNCWFGMVVWDAKGAIK